MPIATTFNEIVEAADSLSMTDQEALVDLLRHRLAAARRQELERAVREARREFESGQAQIASVAEIMDDLTIQD